VGIAASPDFTSALAALDAEGLAVLPSALSPAEIAEVRRRLYEACAASEADGVPTRGYAFDPDDRNRRVFHLFNLDPVFVDLVQRSPALAFVRHLIGADFLVSNFSANITAPGSARMQLHADQGYVPAPWPDRPYACNVAWLLDDLTEENGGTRYVPGSHRRGHGPGPGDGDDTVAIEAPAGALLVMDGRLWHQTGANRSATEERAVLFGYYVQRWLRPQVSWNTVLWPETVAHLDPAFLHLLGYYTGNVEFQIPHGRRATARPPAGLEGDLAAFALGARDGGA
jgi:fumagillin biosynthesis dioxygenase